MERSEALVPVRVLGVIIVSAIQIFKAIVEEQAKHRRNEHYKVIILKDAYGCGFKVVWLDSIGVIFRTNQDGVMVGKPIKFVKCCVDKRTNSVDFFDRQDCDLYRNVLTIYASHYILYWSDFL